MNLDYRLIQYVEDSTRGEGRSIGVIAHGEGKAHYRGLGVGKDGTVDSSYFGALSSLAGKNEWVYREWAGWFQSLVENEGKNPDQFDRLMRGLEAPAAGIVARRGGLLEVPEGEDPEKAMDWLFTEVVRTPKRSHKKAFTENLELVLTDSQISDRQDFFRDIEVEFASDSNIGTELVNFSYILEAPPRAVFKAINFNSNRSSLVRQVNDALYCFERAVANGFVSRDRCIVLAGNISKGNLYLNQLGSVAHIIDIRASDAAEVIRIHAVGRYRGFSD